MSLLTNQDKDQRLITSTDDSQFHSTLMMTSPQVVKTSVNATINCSSEDYTHPENHTLPTYDMTSGFKPLTVII